MNPHQKNKIDINSLSADEQRLFRLYGKLPNKKDLLQNKLKERKYFDSGDYALSKAGKASDTGVNVIGTEHPNADNIPHLSPLTHSTTTGSIAGTPSIEGDRPILPGAGLHRGSINGIPGGNSLGGGMQGGTSRSPVKESSFLARTTSVDEAVEGGHAAEGIASGAAGISPPPMKEAMPIRR